MSRHSGFARMLIRNPRLYAALEPLISHLLAGSALSARVRELMILRIAWRMPAPYEWHAHVAAARRRGLTDDDIVRVTEDPVAAPWPAEDRAVVTAVDELLDSGTISAGLWRGLSAFLDETQLVELPVFVGGYVMLAFAHNSLHLPPNSSMLKDDAVMAIVPFPGGAAGA